MNCRPSTIGLYLDGAPATRSSQSSTVACILGQRQPRHLAPGLANPDIQFRGLKLGDLGHPISVFDPVDKTR